MSDILNILQGEWGSGGEESTALKEEMVVRFCTGSTSVPRVNYLHCGCKKKPTIYLQESPGTLNFQLTATQKDGMQSAISVSPIKMHYPRIPRNDEKLTGHFSYQADE